MVEAFYLIEMVLLLSKGSPSYWSPWPLQNRKVKPEKERDEITIQTRSTLNS